MNNDELNKRYIAQLEEEKAKYEADTEQAKQIMEEIELQRKEKYADFIKEQRQYKKEMEELQEGRKHHDSIIGVKTKNQIILQ